jgi:hypothetical protein
MVSSTVHQSVVIQPQEPSNNCRSALQRTSAGNFCLHFKLAGWARSGPQCTLTLPFIGEVMDQRINEFLIPVDQIRYWDS